MGRLSSMVSFAGRVVQASFGRLFPDTALLHQRDLPVDHFLFIFRVVAGEAIQVEVFGIDRLLVDNPGHFRTDVLQPIGDLGM